MVVKRIKHLRGLGILRDGAAPDNSNFCRRNLIYGFNASGKTTLTRVFASFEHGEIDPGLPPGCQFALELTDGKAIGTEGGIDLLRNKIAVFNTDFVEQNFRWKDGAANPIFYIGREQAGLAQELEETQRGLDAALAEQQHRNRELQQIIDTRIRFKRDTARTIGEQLYDRKYNAGHLDSDYQRTILDKSARLNEGRQRELRAILGQESPLPKLPPLSDIEYGAQDLASLAREAGDWLEQSSGGLILADLREHSSMLNWVREGVRYHTEHELKVCLFCAGPITEDRLTDLALVIDVKLELILSKTRAFLERAEAIAERLPIAGLKLPSANDLVVDQRAAYAASTETYRDCTKRASAAIDDLLKSLRRKVEAPNTAISYKRRDVDGVAGDIARTLLDINTIIGHHNDAHDEFAQTQIDARQVLRKQYLYENQDRYRELESQFEAAQAAADEADKVVAGKTETVDTLRSRLRQHGPAADVINRLLQSYLRHGEITISALENGFQIFRHGAPIVGKLSEGEKTAIAFCYFLSTLRAENRKLKDLIVVVDDPISSLDTRALNYAFAVMKSHLSSAKQLFVLTHNLSFMIECRKWLRKGADEGNASLLFLDVRQDQNGTRYSVLETLPKLIREYESEYHYLFSLVHELAEKRDHGHPHLYLMPNAMRKLADIFLAFRRAGNEGFANKIEGIASSHPNIDADHIRALERLVQAESHAENLDDLVTFSAMSIEECVDCAVALMRVIETLDPDHYKRLCRLCA